MNKDNFPYLVQRLIYKEKADLSYKGVDQNFSMDYMGSAEFEFGSLFKALKNLRSSKICVPKRIEIYAHPGFMKKPSKCTSWYIGSEEDFELAKAFFIDQLGQRNAKLKELTYMTQSYGLLTDDDKFYKSSNKRFSGWWNVTERKSSWCIFKKKYYAELFLTGLKSK